MDISRQMLQLGVHVIPAIDAQDPANVLLCLVWDFR